MGWETDLLDASFRGVPFECVTISDSIKKTLAIKQPPYSNSASVDDMGAEPRRVTLRALFAGADYKSYVDALEAAVLMRGAGELVHPVYGIQQANVDDYKSGHDPEVVDGCYIDISFVIGETQAKELFIPVQFMVLDASLLLPASATALQSQLAELQKTNPNAFFAAITKIKNVLNATRRIVGVALRTINNLLSPPAFISDLLNDISRVATFDISDISAIARWRGIAERVRNIGNLFDDDDDINQALPALKQCWRATTIAATVTTVQAMLIATRAEMAVDSDVSLTPPDLASIRQQVRQDIQAAIIAEREISEDTGVDPAQQIAAFKQSADQVHLAIQELIETRPPLITTRITVACTLHWLAHSLYGDFSRADEIKRLNPTLALPFLQPGMELTAYAR